MKCVRRIMSRRYPLLLAVPLLLETIFIVYIFTVERNVILRPWQNEVFREMTRKSLNQIKNIQQNDSTLNSPVYIQNQRKETLNSICKKITIHPPSENLTIVYNKVHKLIYCEVPKIGSTFWLRFIHLLKQNKTASPFAIKPHSVISLKVKEKFTYRDLTLENSTRFLFVRNPYNRLFSAYIDKLFSPNPYFWSSLGKYIIKTFRHHQSRCGHDVTFHEFLQYAVHSETTHKQQNNHVTSIWQLCSPCHTNIKYNIIGKMETFKDDTNFILDDLHLREYKNILKNMSVDAIRDTLYDTAHAYIEMRSSAYRCISIKEAAERIWTKLKVRGFIAADLPVPKKLSYKSKREVFEIFEDAHSKSVSKLGRQGLKRQQRAFFVQAFRKIPKQTVEEIKEGFDMDFRMFGYEKDMEGLLNDIDYANDSFTNILF
ncbi:carbohydrate sulfotransferase 11-like [Argopecten irradians]|uniref:carbohydrate sulfotransferase 11-like n=1 Tax=Argopecten irradians TaxID=31199 RepID=UPI003716CEE3